MIDKFRSLALGLWTDGAWGSAEGESFLKARRELYEITDAQYADVNALIEKLEKGVAYLARAVEGSAPLEKVRAEAEEYCSIKGCEGQVDSLLTVFMARRGAPSVASPSTAITVASSQAKASEDEATARQVEHDLYLALDNRLWFDFDRVMLANLHEFSRLAISKRTSASLLRSNFGPMCSKALENIANFLSTEIVKRGHFDDWNGLFEAIAEQTITFANELDQKVHEIAFEAINHTTRFQAANRQDPNHKYLSFSALGVIAGVGSLLSEMQRNNESAEYANDIDRELAHAVEPVIEETVNRMFQTSTSFYDAFAGRNGLMSYHDMNGRQERAAGLIKSLPKITDPVVAARGLAKVFEEFPFQGEDFIQLVAKSAAPEQFKRALLTKLEPYLIENIVEAQAEPEPPKVSLIRRVASSYRSLGDAKVWIASDVPYKKLANFNSDLGSAIRVSPGEVVLYCDDTVFGKGDDGLLVSDERIILRIPFDGVRVIPLSQLTGVAMSGLVNKTIAFSWSGGGCKFTFTQNNAAAKLVFDVLECYLAQR